MQLSYRTEVFQPDRYRVDHPYHRDWNFEIRSVQTDDAGTYSCRTPSVTKTVQLVIEGRLVLCMNINFFVRMAECYCVLRLLLLV